MSWHSTLRDPETVFGLTTCHFPKCGRNVPHVFPCTRTWMPSAHPEECLLRSCSCTPAGMEAQPDLGHSFASEMRWNRHWSFCSLTASSCSAGGCPVLSGKHFGFQAVLSSSGSKGLIAIFRSGFFPVKSEGPAPLGLSLLPQTANTKPKSLECDQRPSHPEAADTKCPQSLCVRAPISVYEPGPTALAASLMRSYKEMQARSVNPVLYPRSFLSCAPRTSPHPPEEIF